VKYKLFKVKINNRDEALLFIDWIHTIEPPFHLQINEKDIYTIVDNIEKLFWLTGFESLLD